ncbi:MAG: hypothetical protein C4305_10210, partial [Thermoleophilia bacterium]
MTGLVHERLAGCTSQSLDSYLRGVGFFLLAGDADPAVRSWWDEDGVLWLASSQRLEVLCEAVADRLLQAEPPLRTPFRGAQGRGTPFVAHRNAANEAELDWL